MKSLVTRSGQKRTAEGMVLAAGVLLLTIVTVNQVFFSGVMALSLFIGLFAGICVSAAAARRAVQQGRDGQARMVRRLELCLVITMAGLSLVCRPVYTTGQAIALVERSGFYSQVQLDGNFPTVLAEPAPGPLVGRVYRLTGCQGEEAVILYFDPVTGEFCLQ